MAMTSRNWRSSTTSDARSARLGNPSQAIKSHVDAEDLQKLETLTAGDTFSAGQALAGV